MPGNTGNGVASHFGRQLKKSRMSRNWSIRELSAHMGVDPGHLSRIETGRRPPTEQLAFACDHVFPERDGWFIEYYR
ncbi:MAG TPA: helix-turn-helix transcriptional regulator, partial [Trebonia sp.]